MKTFILQGDSVTDSDRMRDDWRYRRGNGYAALTAAHLMCRYPGKIQVYNLGINGSNLLELYARMCHDTLHLKPDYLSILIGDNDAGEALNQNNVEGALRRFGQVYRHMLGEIREALPQTKVYLLEPFSIPAKGTYHETLRRFAAEVRATAEDCGVPFIPLQDMMSRACEEAPADNWMKDGVHPTAAGGERIARVFCEAVRPDLDRDLLGVPGKED